MKHTKQIIICLLIVSLLLPALCLAALAADYEGQPEQTVNVTFSFADCYGIDGKVTLSNPDIFVDGKVTIVNETPEHSPTINQANGKLVIYGTTKTTVKFSVNATIKADAKAGDKCIVYFEGRKCIDALKGEDVKVSVQATVTVKAKPVDESSSATSSDDTSSATSSDTSSATSSDTSSATSSDTSSATSSDTSSATSSDTSSATSSDTSSTTSSETSKRPDVSKPPVVSEPDEIDYTELNRQIEIANSLQKDGYTDQSWNAMIDALNAAIELRTSQSQADVDAGALALKNAIAALQKVDYSKLIAAIEEANKFLGSNDLADLWNNFLTALDKAEQAKSSGDQEAIDAAADKLLQALEALKKGLENTASVDDNSQPEEPTVPDNFCNIGWHTLCIILLIVSAILNVIFLVLGVIFFTRRKKNQSDDTPLVDYNIGDDDKA